MGPKIEAAIRFVAGGGERAYITSLEKAVEALEGRAGTEIYRGEDPSPTAQT
jgi:carbamate kinase